MKGEKANGESNDKTNAPGGSAVEEPAEVK